MVHLKSQPTEISFWLSSQPLGSYHISSGHCTRIHHRCCKHIRDIIISRKPPNWHQHRQHHWNQDNCAHSTMPSKEITCMNNRRVTGRPCGKKRPYRNLKKRKLKLSMHFLHFFVESSLLIFTFHDIAEYPWASDKQTSSSSFLLFTLGDVVLALLNSCIVAREDWNWGWCQLLVEGKSCHADKYVDLKLSICWEVYLWKRKPLRIAGR